MIKQDIWQVQYLTEGIHKIKYKECSFFLECESVKDRLININVYLIIRIIQTKLMKNWKSDLKAHLSFLITISTT